MFQLISGKTFNIACLTFHNNQFFPNVFQLLSNYVLKIKLYDHHE